MENNQVVKSENSPAIVADTVNKSYCSFKPKTLEEKKHLFNALENCDVKLNDIVGQSIKVKNLYIQEYSRTDKNTGEPISNGHRTILFDEAGKTYVTASNYFFVSIAKLLDAIGTPDTWEEPLEIEIVKRAVGDGKQCLSFKLQ